jgi:hypothetical protein
VMAKGLAVLGISLGALHRTVLSKAAAGTGWTLLCEGLRCDSDWCLGWAWEGLVWAIQVAGLEYLPALRVSLAKLA